MSHDYHMRAIADLIVAPPGIYEDYDGGLWTKEGREWYDDQGRTFRDMPKFAENLKSLSEDEYVAHAYAFLADLELKPYE